MKLSIAEEFEKLFQIKIIDYHRIGKCGGNFNAYFANMYSLHRIHTIMSKEHLFMKAKVAERGQVTIPKALRERLGIRPGTILEFKEDRGKLVAVKAVAMDTVDQLYGTLGSGRRTDDIMQEIRGGL